MKTIRTITTLFTLLLFTSVTFAQETGPAIASKYPGFEARIKKSDESIANPKKNVKVKTFLKRAELMLEVADVHALLLEGTQQFQVKLFLGDPLSVETYQENGKTLEKNIFERVNVVFENGVLVSFEETKKFVEDPLTEAYKALQKAEELDVENKDSDDIKENFDELKRQLQAAAIKEIRTEDYADALSSLEQYIAIGKKPFYGETVDTTIYYFAAYSAYLEKDYAKTIKYGTIVKETNYDEPYNYFILTKSYYEEADSTSGLEVLKEGFQKYADNQYIINELINYYLVREQAENALEYIGIAKKGNPNNASYYFAEGTLYDKLEDLESAAKSYEGAIAVDPEFFNAYFNLSVLYYNHAVKLYNDAAKASDSEYKAIQEEADNYVVKAIDPMVKAHELSPEDLSVLENLQTYFYRLRLKSDDYKTKWEEYKAKVDSLK